MGVDWGVFVEALTFRLDYTATLVALGAALLGATAGGVGAFLTLRKRALVNDAAAHATLPGLCVAFVALVWLGFDGTDAASLPGLMVGAAATAALGLVAVDWMARRTRLSEDAAIGAVLSVFYGVGVVLLTVVQDLPAGGQAGLEAFLLGSTAGMRLVDAATIAVGGALTAVAAFALRRPMAMVAFDPDYAAASGAPVRAIDLAALALGLAATVIGLRLVGLVLIVALLIVPGVAARFWTDRVDRLALLAAGLGAASGWIGAALSAAAEDAPTGPLIVLVAGAAFAVSMLFAPRRGAVSALLRRRRLHRRVHLRQGLLAVARAETIHDPLTLRVLRRDGLIRADGVATDAGRARAAKAARDEARWALARADAQDPIGGGRLDGLRPIEEVFTADEIADLDRRLGPPRSVAP